MSVDPLLPFQDMCGLSGEQDKGWTKYVKLSQTFKINLGQTFKKHHVRLLGQLPKFYHISKSNGNITWTILPAFEDPSFLAHVEIKTKYVSISNQSSNIHGSKLCGSFFPAIPHSPQPLLIFHFSLMAPLSHLKIHIMDSRQLANKFN